jgi:putative nucleotidyltransferase with HDIG domain
MTASGPPPSVLAFAHALLTTAQNRALHGRDSVHVEDSLVSLIVALRSGARAGVEMPLQLQFSDDQIHHDGRPLVGPSLQAQDLLRELAARQIAALSFAEALGVEEANRLFDLLLLEPNRDALLRRHRDQSLRAFGIRNVRVTSRSPGDPSDRFETVAGATADDLHRYQDLAAIVQQNNALAHRDQNLAVERAHSVVERALLRIEVEPSGLLALAAQDEVDRFTVGHSVRVALLALQVARSVGASRDQLVQVGTAALLHDIGKSKVPQEVLFKEGALDADEWHWMAQHPRLGADILLEQSDLVPSAVGAAFCHHMRTDAKGYPRPAVPVRPSGTSRLVRVCDVFEALTSVRPYKRALTPCEAYAVMRRDEFAFDQRWLRLFVRTLGFFPLGTRVELDDGSIAVVREQGARPDRPVVRLLSGPGGDDLEPGAPDEITVGVPQDGAARTVRSVHTHGRTVPLPPPDSGPAEILTQTVHGACLRTPAAPPD